MKRLPTPGLVAGMYLRTKHIDSALDESLREGVNQVVILGAGFDSRGYRFEDRLRGVVFIEVDYGPTQEYKKRRVREVLGRVPPHGRYVAMDFTKDDLLTQLHTGGYSEMRKTLFIWEGVVNYIPEAAVRNTLIFVRDHSAPGSRIIFDYPLARYPRINDASSLFAKWGEPMIFGFRGRAHQNSSETSALKSSLTTSSLNLQNGMR